MRRAFSLLELLIAIGLSTMVLLVAFTAFRVAAQANRTATRLALENTLVRAGMAVALEELDFWQGYDDPEAATPDGRVLRRLQDTSVDGARLGLPFTPMAQAFPRQDLGGSGSLSESQRREYAIGWDGDPAKWAAHDSSAWYRGNLAEHGSTRPRATLRAGVKPDSLAYVSSDLRFGYYKIFASRLNDRTTPRWSAQSALDAPEYASINQDPQGRRPPQALPAAYSNAPIPGVRSWLPNQVHGLMNGLGFYALCDYLPSNAIYAWYENYPRGGDDVSAGLATHTQGGIPVHLVCAVIAPFSTTTPFCFDNITTLSESTESFPRGLLSQSNMASYAIINPANWSLPAVPPAAELDRGHHRYWPTDVNTVIGDGAAAEASQLATMIDRTSTFTALLPRQPDHWPKPQVSVGRFIKGGRFVNVCKVRWSDPLTGHESELSFTGVGTTLRGARQQRASAGGWAEWDNARRLADGSRDDSAQGPTLDTY